MANVISSIDIAMTELTSLSFLLSACTELMTKPGSNEREVMKAAGENFKHRMEYLRLTLQYEFEKLTAAAVADKLSEGHTVAVGAGVAAASAGAQQQMNQAKASFMKQEAQKAQVMRRGLQWTPEQVEQLQKEIAKPYDQVQIDRLCGVQIKP